MPREDAVVELRVQHDALTEELAREWGFVYLRPPIDPSEHASSGHDSSHDTARRAEHLARLLCADPFIAGRALSEFEQHGATSESIAESLRVTLPSSLELEQSFKKQTCGVGHFAWVELLVHPSRSGRVSLDDRQAEPLRAELREAFLKGLRRDDAQEISYSIAIELLRSRVHPTDTTPSSYEICGRMVIQQLRELLGSDRQLLRPEVRAQEGRTFITIQEALELGRQGGELAEVRYCETDGPESISRIR